MTLWTFLSLCLFVSITLQQHCNSPPPLSFPIRNVTLQSQVVRRGFPLWIGTPPQQISFAIHGDRDNVMVHAGNRITGAVGGHGEHCGFLCTWDRGGLFQPDLSTSMKLSENQGHGKDLTSQHSEEQGDFVELPLGNDSLKFNYTFGLPDFELKASGVGKRPEQNVLGLGRNSTLLERLYMDGTILSRSWSLFWGLERGDILDQMDGSLVLGGYDKAKTSGNNFTGDLTHDGGCPSSMLVYLEDVRVDFPNGTHSSLFASQRERLPKRACIRPEAWLINLPTTLRRQFTSAMGGTYIGPSSSLKEFGILVSTDKVTKGNLTFVLASGLALTVPNYLLLLPEVHANTTNTTGIHHFEYLPYGPSIREIPMSSEDIGDDRDIILGQIFLSSVYLHVNNDESKFTLWQANPTRHENLVTVGKATDCTRPVSIRPLTTISSKPKPASKFSAAIAASKLVGASIGLTALILLLFFWKRKRQSGFHPHERKPLKYGTFKEMLCESPASFVRGTSVQRELVWRPIYETRVHGPRTSKMVDLATVAEETSLLLPPGIGEGKVGGGAKGKLRGMGRREFVL